MLRSGHGWRLGRVPDVNSQHSSRANGVLHSCLVLCDRERGCVHVCACAFSHFYYINLYFHCVPEHGEQGLQGLWVCAKTIIKDRDSGRLCENVFM